MNNISDNSISLIRDTHKYTLASKPDLTFTSVTTFIGKFFEEFDSLKIARNLVKNNPKYFDYTVESLISEWNDSAAYGTMVHNEIEDWIKNGIEPKDLKSINAKIWLQKYKSKINVKIIPEVIIYSEELRIAGTIDVLAQDVSTNEYILIDWKTSKKISTVSYNHKTGVHDATKNIMDCNFYHYSLQLSLYRYILETFYGLIVRNQVIAHIKDNGVETHIAPYMKREIISMLDS